MKKLFLFLAISMALASHVRADNGPYHFNRILNSATSVTTTANAFTLLTGSKVDAKKVMIAEDTRSLNLYIAFSDANTINGSYWLQTPNDGIFDQPVKVNPDFGVMVGTTLTAGTGPAPTVRLMLVN